MLADVVTLDKGLIQSGVCRGRADGVLHSAASWACWSLLGTQHKRDRTLGSLQRRPVGLGDPIQSVTSAAVLGMDR